LFNTLRKFKLDEGDGDCTQEVSPSEVETVRRMVAMFFESPRRDPVYYVKLVFVSGVLGPNSTATDRDGACHRYIIKTE
jgi:hypothetical protein